MLVGSETRTGASFTTGASFRTGPSNRSLLEFGSLSADPEVSLICGQTRGLESDLRTKDDDRDDMASVCHWPHATLTYHDSDRDTVTGITEIIRVRRRVMIRVITSVQTLLHRDILISNC